MTALITGASSGIGLELARIFARNRHDVVLVARRAPALQVIAAELEREGIRATSIASDLSAEGSAEDVVARVASIGVEIDVLVNNAGYGLYGPFLETDIATERAMIQLNIVALTELTKRLLPSMVARRRGRIMNVASTAAYFPGPLMAVYYATKAYVLSFSQAIANEVEGTGVTVTALCPGPTESGFQAAAHAGDSKLFAGKSMRTSRAVAEEAYAGMMAGKRVVITGIGNKLLVGSTSILPGRALAAIVRQVQERKKE